MFEMTPALRARLTEAYESERPNWGDAYTNHFLAKLADLPDGTHEPTPGFDSDDSDELTLEPAGAVALGIEYFGIHV